MAIFAHCSRCHKYHRRGTQIFNDHKDYLGMYIDTSTGSRRRKKDKGWISDQIKRRENPTPKYVTIKAGTPVQRWSTGIWYKTKKDTKAKYISDKYGIYRVYIGKHIYNVDWTGVVRE